MKLKQCIGVMVAFSLLLLNCIEMGWAEEKPVFDDDGNIITEEVIMSEKTISPLRALVSLANRINLRVLHLWMMK